MFTSAQKGCRVLLSGNAAAVTLFLTLATVIPNEALACHRGEEHGKETNCEGSGGGGGGHNTGGGGGKGGFGELGNACLNLENTAGEGKIYNDGVSEYCHGEDGQISVPSRFRIDTKKFNSNESTYFVNATCQDSWCANAWELKGFQSQLRYNQNGTLYNPDNVSGEFSGEELDLQTMKEGDVARVSMSVAAKTQGTGSRLLFAKNSGGSFRCTEVNDSDTTGPVWVKCTANDIPDSSVDLCDRWTISTSDLSGSITPAPNATACLIVQDELVENGVVADFEMDVCVLGADEIAPCPVPDW